MSAVRLSLAVILTAACCLGSARGQEIMTLDGDFIRWLDPRTGQVLRTGWALGATGTWSGLAKDSQGTLYGCSGNYFTPYRIYEIDPSTASTRLVSQTSLLGVSAIAFGAGDVLYALNDPSVPFSGVFDLVRIDLATGNSTLIGSTGNRYVFSLTYGLGTLWAWSGGYNGSGLVRIDPLTGLAVDVNPAVRGPMDATDSLCSSDDGVLYLVDYGLWIVDTLTGVPAFVDFIPGIPLSDAAEFMPNLPAPFSLGVRGETGHPMGAFVAGATPNGTVALLHGDGYGGPDAIGAGLPCSGILLDLNAPVTLIRILTAGPDGKAEIGPAYVPLQVRGRVRLQALDLTTCEVTNVARIVF